MKNGKRYSSILNENMSVASDLIEKCSQPKPVLPMYFDEMDCGLNALDRKIEELTNLLIMQATTNECSYGKSLSEFNPIDEKILGSKLSSYCRRVRDASDQLAELVSVVQEQFGDDLKLKAE